MNDWEPGMCRAKRWDGLPAYDGPHPHHLFYYGPHDVYCGHCAGVEAVPGAEDRQADDPAEGETRIGD